MKGKIRAIHVAFDGKLVGSYRMKLYVCSTLSHMPDKIVRYITRKCWFISSFEDAWAFTFTGNDLKNQHLIFLSDELLEQPVEQIRHTIAHEIGHVVLGHRNSVLERQSKEEIKKQEEQAEDFVKEVRF